MPTLKPLKCQGSNIYKKTHIITNILHFIELNYVVKRVGYYTCEVRWDVKVTYIKLWFQSGSPVYCFM